MDEKGFNTEGTEEERRVRSEEQRQEHSYPRNTG